MLENIVQMQVQIRYAFRIVLRSRNSREISRKSNETRRGGSEDKVEVQVEAEASNKMHSLSRRLRLD